MSTGTCRSMPSFVDADANAKGVLNDIWEGRLAFYSRDSVDSSSITKEGGSRTQNYSNTVGRPGHRFFGSRQHVSPVSQSPRVCVSLTKRFRATNTSLSPSCFFNKFRLYEGISIFFRLLFLGLPLPILYPVPTTTPLTR